MTATRKASFAEQTTPASATQTTTLASATLNAGATSNAYSFALGNIYLAAGDSVEFVSHAIAATDSAGVSVTVTGIPVTRAVEDNPFLFWAAWATGTNPISAELCAGAVARYGTGQWLSVDPVDGEPRYSYAYQSPTLFTDASGRKPVIIFSRLSKKKSHGIS